MLCPSVYDGRLDKAGLPCILHPLRITSKEAGRLMGSTPGRHKGNGHAQNVYLSTSSERVSPLDICGSFIIGGRDPSIGQWGGACHYFRFFWQAV